MNHSWRGPLGYRFIHVFIHSVWRKDSLGFLGFRWIPLDSLGSPDELLEGFQIHGYHEGFVYLLPCCEDCLRISISRSFSVAPTHEKLMAPSWITHEGAEFLRFLKIPVDSSGLLRNSWRRLEDPRLSWNFSPLNYLRDLFKDVRLFSVAPTHEAFMTHWWTTHSSASWKVSVCLMNLAFLWPWNMTAEKIKERNTHEPLMIYSWTTHKRGPLDTNSFMYSYIPYE